MSLLAGLVVLHPATGRLRGDVPITSDNIDEVLPDPDRVRLAMAWFEDAGFSVEAPGPICFSIVADESVFVRWFGPSGAFDVERLPARVADVVAAVEIEEPPDFGPGNP